MRRCIFNRPAAPLIQPHSCFFWGETCAPSHFIQFILLTSQSRRWDADSDEDSSRSEHLTASFKSTDNLSDTRIMWCSTVSGSVSQKQTIRGSWTKRQKGISGQLDRQVVELTCLQVREQVAASLAENQTRHLVSSMRAIILRLLCISSDRRQPGDGLFDNDPLT